MRGTFLPLLLAVSVALGADAGAAGNPGKGVGKREDTARPPRRSVSTTVGQTAEAIKLRFTRQPDVRLRAQRQEYDRRIARRDFAVWLKTSAAASLLRRSIRPGAKGQFVKLNLTVDMPEVPYEGPFIVLLTRSGTVKVLPRWADADLRKPLINPKLHDYFLSGGSLADLQRNIQETATELDRDPSTIRWILRQFSGDKDTGYVYRALR